MLTERKKICFVATIPAVVHSFLRPHIQAASVSYQVTLICNPVDAHLLAGIQARIILLPIDRQPALWRDIGNLFRLYRIFRQERFDIVHTHMPKTGVLGIAAAWLAGISVRIHTFHGEVWATRCGLRRWGLKQADKLVVALATQILAVSPSQQRFLEQQGILPAGRGRVIGVGSVCGVDVVRFHPDVEAGRRMRQALGIPPTAVLLLYVGRLNRDKGLLDLAVAFSRMASEHSDIELLLVGAEEDVSLDQLRTLCGLEAERLHHVPFTPEPERYMQAADIYCLPSYREGFGLTIIEAAACGLPAVATRIHGIVDAVDEGSTGILCPPADVDALIRALSILVKDADLRCRMGREARERAIEYFAASKIIGETIAMYDGLLMEANLRTEH